MSPNEMKCQQCGDKIEPGEEMEHLGRTLCEDCYMDALSPVKACDPWATRMASRFSPQDGDSQLTDQQQRIIDVISQAVFIERADLADRTEIEPTELDRELASLRHMEMIRGCIKDGRKMVTRFDQPQE